MTAGKLEVLRLDRLNTPIGVALLVTDADGVLRALDREDYEPRMRQLLRHEGVAVQPCHSTARVARARHP